MPGSVTPDSCEVEDSEALMDEKVFFGNTAMVFGTLLAIFVMMNSVLKFLNGLERIWQATQTFRFSHYKKDSKIFSENNVNSLKF